MTNSKNYQFVSMPANDHLTLRKQALYVVLESFDLPMEVQNDKVSIRKVNLFCFLGVLLDNSLSWKLHLSFISTDGERCWYFREISPSD